MDFCYWIKALHRGYDTSGGNDTQDKVFLLSYKEACEEYFNSGESRICKPTTYARDRGAYTNDGGNIPTTRMDVFVPLYGSIWNLVSSN